MIVLVDTSVLIDHLRGHDGAHCVLAGAIESGRLLACSVVTRVEVLAGMRPGEERATRTLLDSFDWIAVDDSIADRAGLLANQYLRSHPGVDPVDFIIAATAEEHDAELWTMNLKHFPMLPDLQSPY